MLLGDGLFLEHFILKHDLHLLPFRVDLLTKLADKVPRSFLKLAFLHDQRFCDRLFSCNLAGLFTLLSALMSFAFWLFFFVEALDALFQLLWIRLCGFLHAEGCLLGLTATSRSRDDFLRL